jgi:prevent-host-death family protein
MITIPCVTTVAEFQRAYRSLVEKIKLSGEPMIVVSNGKPDVVVVDVETYKAQSERLKELEEQYLLNVYKKGLDESLAGKTTKLKKGQKLLGII